MYTYKLQKYKGKSTRHTCPNCGKRYSFTYYVDERNIPLHPSVGRCNHESSCGYHYPPKQYFLDHPECRTANNWNYHKEQTQRLHMIRPASIGYIPQDYVDKSQSGYSNFVRFLSALLTSHYEGKATEVISRVLREYRIGATHDGAVIYWQIDCTNKVRTGKVMQYNPADGHRVKDQQAGAINWIHSILKKRKVLSDEWQLSQCLFGEHLLSANPDKLVVLVEAEKSAIIGSAIFPAYVWLATGGKSQLNAEKLRVLKGRTVLLFPDADAFAEWQQRTKDITFCKLIVSDIIEKNATPEQKAAHIDVADWIIYQIQSQTVTNAVNHLREEEKICQQMIEKNPVLQTLIDIFDLKPVEASSGPAERPL